jgi:hypothetical protein
VVGEHAVAGRVVAADHRVGRPAAVGAPTAASTSAMSGAKTSVWKLLVTPCSTAAMRSSPAPVSTLGFGSGTSVPSGCRSNCMNTRFQISRKRPASAPSTNASVVKSARPSSVHSPAAPGGKRKSCRERREVDVDLGARAARARVGHLPEVVAAPEPVDPRVGQPGDLAPQGARLVVLVEDAHAQVLARHAQLAGDELPGEADRVALEIVAEREVAEHLEEGVVPGGVPHLLEVVVLAAGAHALLRRRRPARPAGRVLHAEEDLLERHHPGVGEEQRRVVAGTSELLGRTRWPWRSK